MIELKFASIYDINNNLNLDTMLLYNSMLDNVGAINFYKGDSIVIVTQLDKKRLNIKDYKLINNLVFTNSMDMEIYNGEKKYQYPSFDDKLKIKINFTQDTLMGRGVAFAKLYSNNN